MGALFVALLFCVLFVIVVCWLIDTTMPEPVRLVAKAIVGFLALLWLCNHAGVPYFRLP